MEKDTTAPTNARIGWPVSAWNMANMMAAFPPSIEAQ